jgi:hypothetical protein
MGEADIYVTHRLVFEKARAKTFYFCWESNLQAIYISIESKPLGHESNLLHVDKIALSSYVKT